MKTGVLDQGLYPCLEKYSMYVLDPIYLHRAIRQNTMESIFSGETLVLNGTKVTAIAGGGYLLYLLLMVYVYETHKESMSGRKSTVDGVWEITILWR